MVTKPTRSRRASGKNAPVKLDLEKLWRGLTPIPPPKSVEELAKEQGIDLNQKVDWEALFTAAFPTKKDIDDFEQYLEDIKGRPSE